jgi:quinol monooxygenase YgiN
MSDNDAKVRRTLQLRFTLPTADSGQLAAMIKAAAPFYQMLGNAQVRLLQNVDDPAKFVQEIEYESLEGWELNRQRIAGDVHMQAYLQAWRAMMPGAPEIDVYQEV